MNIPGYLEYFKSARPCSSLEFLAELFVDHVVVESCFSRAWTFCLALSNLIFYKIKKNIWIYYLC